MINACLFLFIKLMLAIWRYFRADGFLIKLNALIRRLLRVRCSIGIQCLVKFVFLSSNRIWVRWNPFTGMPLLSLRIASRKKQSTAFSKVHLVDDIHLPGSSVILGDSKAALSCTKTIFNHLILSETSRRKLN